jgi:hypothetical protein
MQLTFSLKFERFWRDWEYYLATPFVVLDGDPKGLFMRVGPTYRTLAFLLAGALLSGDVHSQTTTSGGLAGVVIDQTNAVVPDGTRAVLNQRFPRAAPPDLFRFPDHAVPATHPVEISLF